MGYYCLTSARHTLLIFSPFFTNDVAKKKYRGFEIKARFNKDDPLLKSASESVKLRFQEMNRPVPLFHDLYAGCLLDDEKDEDVKKPQVSMEFPSHYCLATKFIDDQLLSEMKQNTELRQIVLLTDGMDTRPYRLNWPRASIIFGISPANIFKIASQKLDVVGAKLPRATFFVHVPLEGDVIETLRTKGFDGTKPSIWVFQGLPIKTLASFNDILFLVSSLAMKGCAFLGEIPVWLSQVEIDTKISVDKWVEKLFMNSGFKVNMVSYDEIARKLNQPQPFGDNKNVFFVAEQLQLSDDQVEIFRREIRRVEEDGDEESFEDI